MKELIDKVRACSSWGNALVGMMAIRRKKALERRRRLAREGGDEEEDDERRKEGAGRGEEI